MWTYKGLDIFQADRNSMGLRWYARVPFGPLNRLWTYSKADMRQMITQYLHEHRRS